MSLFLVRFFHHRFMNHLFKEGTVTDSKPVKGFEDFFFFLKSEQILSYGELTKVGRKWSVYTTVLEEVKVCSHFETG